MSYRKSENKLIIKREFAKNHFLLMQTGALEGQNILKHNVKISLSEEQLVDCSKTNHGCQGGHMIKAYQYIQEHGISTEESYPYTAGKTQDAGVCKSGENSGIKVTGFVTINSTESALKEAVGKCHD